MAKFRSVSHDDADFSSQADALADIATLEGYTTWTTFEFEYGGNVYAFTANQTDDEKVVVDVFWEVLARWASQSSRFRTTTWLCVSVSFTLVVITAIQNIIFVARYFIMGFL